MAKKAPKVTVSDKPKNKGGRPTDYCPEIAKLICERVATHDVGIQRLVDMYDDMPSKTTIRLWKLHHIEFSTQYADAKRQQVENFAEDTIDIADDGSRDYFEDMEGRERFNAEHVQRSRLRVDTRKWLASKLAPKIYGDLTKVEVQKSEDDPLLKEALERQKALDAKNKKDY